MRWRIASPVVIVPVLVLAHVFDRKERNVPPLTTATLIHAGLAAMLTGLVLHEVLIMRLLLLALFLLLGWASRTLLVVRIRRQVAHELVAETLCDKIDRDLVAVETLRQRSR